MIRNLVFLFVVIIVPFKSYASSFTVLNNLSFGTLIPVTVSGSVSVGLNSSITTNGSVTVAPSGTGYYAGLGVYKGTGLSAVLEVLTINVLNSSVILSNGSGGAITVNNFVTTPNLAISLATQSKNVYVGGTMNFTSASSPGVYTGSVQVRGSSLLSGNATMTLPIILTFWRPLSVSQTTQLNFGGIESLTGNSTVRIAAQTGNRSVVSGIGAVNLISSIPGAAGAFQITGNPNTAVTITLPSTTTLTGPGAAMTVNNFKRSPSSSTTLNAAGNLTLKVGADLKINTAQASGTYNGTYTLTVSY